MSERLGRGAPALLGVLLGLLAITLPELGSDPWPFRPPSVHPQGVLAPLVRAAGEKWDVGIARSVCFLAALLVGAVGVLVMTGRALSRRLALALVVIVALALLLPSTLLQMGLRQSTAPFFHTNDSTYQIELAGDLLKGGHSPYGHDYRRSGMERFYTFDGSESPGVREREVSLRHYAYFPGTAITAAPWRLLPAPFDDYRLLVVLATLAGLVAAMAFRAPLSWRLAIGALLVANPIAVRSAWFGQNDAPSLTLLVLAFALATRGRWRWAAASLAAAVLFKQFALVGAPFLAALAVQQGVGRRELRTAGLVFAGLLAAGILPFLIADPVAFYDDTVKFGAGTYRIVGYGLSGLLVRAHIVAGRDGAYPFAPIALLTWLPLTVWLVRAQLRGREAWLAGAGFAISMLWLMFIGRTFNNYYLVWPMTGAAIAALLYAASPSLSSSSPPTAGARTRGSGP